MSDNEFETFELNEEAKPYNISHRCCHFSKEVVLFIKECKFEKVYSSLFDQLLRSATSIGANLVEGRPAVQKRIGRIFRLSL